MLTSIVDKNHKIMVGTRNSDLITKSRIRMFNVDTHQNIAYSLENIMMDCSLKSEVA